MEDGLDVKLIYFAGESQSLLKYCYVLTICVNVTELRRCPCKLFLALTLRCFVNKRKNHKIKISQRMNEKN